MKYGRFLLTSFHHHNYSPRAHRQFFFLNYCFISGKVTVLARHVQVLNGRHFHSASNEALLHATSIRASSLHIKELSQAETGQVHHCIQKAKVTCTYHRYLEQAQLYNILSTHTNESHNFFHFMNLSFKPPFTVGKRSNSHDSIPFPISNTATQCSLTSQIQNAWNNRCFIP